MHECTTHGGRTAGQSRYPPPPAHGGRPGRVRGRGDGRRPARQLSGPRNRTDRLQDDKGRTRASTADAVGVAVRVGRRADTDDSVRPGHRVTGQH